MAGPLDKHIATLRDANAGWVNRRDAALAIGSVAGQALQALKHCERESDPDVQAEIRKALGMARAGLEGVAPLAGARFSMEDFAREIAKPPKRVVAPEGAGLKVTVQVPGNRVQTVYVQPHDGTSGVKLIRVYTRCGSPREGSYDWALKINLNTALCALALTEENGAEMYWLVAHFLAEHATPSELKAAVKEISFYGDWIEQRMAAEDQH